MVGSPKKKARREALERGTFVSGGNSARKAHGNCKPLTPEIMERVLAFVRSGMVYYETAMAASGVDRATFRRWLQDGARDRDAGVDSLEAKFTRDLEQAKAEAEVRRLARVDRAAVDREVETVKIEVQADGTERTVEKMRKQERGDWRAAAWALERTDPQRYAQRIRMEVEKEIESVIDELETALPPDAYMVVLQVLARKFADKGEA